MAPFLRPGTLVGVEWSESPEGNAEAGDLLLCRDRSGDWILHRLLDARVGGWIVKGDSGFLSEVFSPEEVWGKVVSLQPPGRAAFPFSRGLLDKGIARVSLLSLTAGKQSARVLRKVTRGLSWLRRWL